MKFTEYVEAQEILRSAGLLLIGNAESFLNRKMTRAKYWCSNLFSVAVKKTVTKSNMKSKGFILLPYPRWQFIERETKVGTQDGNLGARAGAEAMEEHCLLDCLLWLVFLYNPWPSAQTIVAWTIPCQSSINKMAP